MLLHVLHFQLDKHLNVTLATKFSVDSCSVGLQNSFFLKQLSATAATKTTVVMFCMFQAICIFSLLPCLLRNLRTVQFYVKDETKFALRMEMNLTFVGSAISGWRYRVQASLNHGCELDQFLFEFSLF